VAVTRTERLMALVAFAALPACTRSEPAPSPRTFAPESSERLVPSASAEAVAPSAPLPEPAQVVPPMPPPLEHEGELIALDVPGFQPAVVSVPSGVRAAHPVAVALHGNFDRPEWQCEVFRPVIGDTGFLLCPRGKPRRDVPKSLDRWEYQSGKAMAAELDAALAALGQRYGERVDPGPVVFIGFSLGAIYGAPIVQKNPARFPRAVFVEGGHNAWTPASAKKFAEAGGQRLLLACGQAPCLTNAQRLTPKLAKAGLPAQSGGSAKAGHTYDGEVAAAVKAAFPWLVEGDGRWDPKRE
jgi:predicted esterase